MGGLLCFSVTLSWYIEALCLAGIAFLTYGDLHGHVTGLIRESHYPIMPNLALTIPAPILVLLISEVKFR